MPVNIRAFDRCSGFKASLATCPHIPYLKDDIYLQSLTYNEDDKKAHEWLDHSTIVKPYYDVDMNFASESEWETQKGEVEATWTSLLEKKYPNAEIAISSCHRRKEDSELGKKKKGMNFFISFHFVVNKYRIKMGDMEEYNAQLGFWDPKKTGTAKIQVPWYDNSAYSNGQNMRMIFQTKPGSTPVPKRPANCEGMNNLHKHFIQFHSTSDLEAAQEIKIDTKLKTQPIDKSAQKPVRKPAQKPIETPTIPAPKDDDISDIEKAYDATKLSAIVNRITSHLNGYEDWIKVVFGVHNITGGDNFGYELIHEWSKHSLEYDSDTFEEKWFKPKWSHLNKERTAKTKKIGWATLIKWAELDNPSNAFQAVYLSNVSYEEDTKGNQVVSSESTPNVAGLVEMLNKELIFVKETGEYIILDKKEDGTPCWFLKGVMKVSDHYNKFTFHDPFTKRETTPFKIWSKNIKRREVIRIGFNPQNMDDPDIFNLWRGFAVTRQDCESADIDDAEALIDHIKMVWCKGDEEQFKYVISYFARIIQIPHKKSGVVLCLKSKQGAGKGVVFDALSRIIGEAHYAQVSNANNVFGDFNGTLEAKILIDLDEAFWGGDKKLEGQIKNKITEKKQIVNKKNKEAYTIDDYANYCITTNNDRFAAASSPEDRRHYAIELDNKWAGRMTSESTSYFDPIVAVCEDPEKLKGFAKLLYTYDISDFNPRIFNKTPLLQEQIQQSWNSVQSWWFATLNDGGFDCVSANCDEDEGFCLWNKHCTRQLNDADSTNVPLTGMKRTMYKKDQRGKKIFNVKTGCDEVERSEVLYYKDFLYSCYAKVAGTGYNKMEKTTFLKALKNDCLDSWFKDVKPKSQSDGKRPTYLKLPSIEEAQAMFNKLQGFEYAYNDGDEDDWDYDSDDS